MNTSEEKIFPPTKRKLKKEKSKGNVWFSNECAHAFFLMLYFLFLLIFFPFFSWKKIFLTIFNHLNELSPESAIKEAFRPLLFSIVMFLFLAVATVLAVYILQKGWIWSWNLQNPFQIKKRKRNFLFPFLKVIISSGVCYLILRPQDTMYKIMFISSAEKIELLYRKGLIIFLSLMSVFLVIGFLDLLYQRWLYFNEMRMSKKEIEDEKRETETKNSVSSKQ